MRRPPGLFFAVAKLFSRRDHTRFVKAEHLVVIRVRQLVQHDPRHPVLFKRRKKILRLGNVDALRERLAVAVARQPVGIGMIPHRVQEAVVAVEFDADRAQFGERGFGDDDEKFQRSLADRRAAAGIYFAGSNSVIASPIAWPMRVNQIALPR